MPAHVRRKRHVEQRLSDRLVERRKRVDDGDTAVPSTELDERFLPAPGLVHQLCRVPLKPHGSFVHLTALDVELRHRFFDQRFDRRRSPKRREALAESSTYGPAKELLMYSCRSPSTALPRTGLEEAVDLVVVSRDQLLELGVREGKQRSMDSDRRLVAEHLEDDIICKLFEDPSRVAGSVSDLR